MIRLPLLGRHQTENCQTALAVLDLLARKDRRITFAPVRRGLGRVSIPARCQVIRDPSPFTLHSSLFYIIDSCHNPESGRALANVLRDYLPFWSPFRLSGNLQSAICNLQFLKVVLVYGSLSGKLVAKTVAPLAPFVERAILVQPDSPRAMPLVELKRIFSRLHVPHVTADSVRSALALARSLARAQAQAQARSGNLQPATCKLQTAMPIVVAGSFYLAGEALKTLGPSRASLACRRP